MPFGLTIGTERAAALQQAIQDELIKREYSAEADPVMAEYITIMIINNKTSEQITSELEDLIGSDFDPTFTDWLFTEASKGAPDAEPPSQPAPPERPAPAPAREAPPHNNNNNNSDTRRNGPRGGGAPLYQQALSQATTSTSQKRTASARSPSPSGHPNKSRRMDLPTGPRAMGGGGSGSGRSLLERVGGPPGRHNGHPRGRDDIQARIDNITGSPDPNMMMANFPNGIPPGMDMNAINMGMAQANPMMLQEMMMNQMAMMAQMASTMGIVPGGFPMQGGMPQDMGMFNGGMNGFPQQPNGGPGGRGRGNGRGRGGSRGGRGGGGAHVNGHANEAAGNEAIAAQSASVAAPTPTAPNPAQIAAAAQRPGFVPPERPQSPSLCKFSTKCTNALCRWSHPSPVATAESGVVLSTEACEKGKDCVDKDCVKSHVSPAVNLPPSEQHNTPAQAPASSTPHVHAQPANTIPCRFGAGCTKPPGTCTFSHPPRHQAQAQAQTQAVACRFGAGCTRATCPFQHPPGRVLPSTFHRGLSDTAPVVATGAPSQHRSLKFNNNSKEAVEEKLKKLEAQKAEAQKAVAEAEAAGKNSKEEAKPTQAIAA